MKTLLALTIVGALATGAAHADQVFNLTDTVTWVNGASSVTQHFATTAGISPTQSFSISDSFNGPPLGADFPASAVDVQAGGPWNFYDDFVFGVASGADVQAALISFSSMFEGLTNLQARIIGVSGTFNPLANLNAPASGNTLIDSWTNVTSADGLSTVSLGQKAFGPGNYDLQIRGEVLGGSGAYGGAISFSRPVPLPAALPLLLPALGLLAAGRRRRPAA